MIPKIHDRSKGHAAKLKTTTESEGQTANDDQKGQLGLVHMGHTYSFFSSLNKTFAQQDVDARARRSLTPKPPPWGRRLGQEDERRKRRKRR